jgi:L-serine deaminase
MAGAVATGLAGTKYGDRILPAQSPNFAMAERQDRLIPADINNRIVRYVSAIMEVKSSMGVIVAAPTAGWEQGEGASKGVRDMETVSGDRGGEERVERADPSP